MTRAKCSFGLVSEDEAVYSFGIPNKISNTQKYSLFMKWDLSLSFKVLIVTTKIVSTPNHWPSAVHCENN